MDNCESCPAGPGGGAAPAVNEPGGPRAGRLEAWPHAIVFAWGLAEATVFFIAPDVFLTRLALRDFGRAAIAGMWAVAGALAGGAGLWLAARHGEAGALLHLFEGTPGINAALVERSAHELSGQGLAALFTGGLRGQPYKLFAVHAGASNVPLAGFMVASAGARSVRFMASITAAWIGGRILGRRSVSFRNWAHAGFWAVFYVIYFAVMR